MHRQKRDPQRPRMVAPPCFPTIKYGRDFGVADPGYRAGKCDHVTHLVPCVDGSLLGKSFFHVLRHWSVQPCVRLFNAARVTAGHNAHRGSGPTGSSHSRMLWHKSVVLIAGSTALHYVLFALPTFTSRRLSGAASLIVQARRVPYIAHPWPCNLGRPPHQQGRQPGPMLGAMDLGNG